MQDERPRKRVLVVAQNVSGHRLNYVRMLIESSLASDFRIAVLGPENMRATPEAAVYLASALQDDRVEWIEAPEISAETVATAARRREVDVTVVPDADPLLLGLMMRWRRTGSALSLLIMREPRLLQRGVRRSSAHAVKLAAMRALQRRGRAQVYVLKGATWAGVSRHSVVRDPVSTTVTSRGLDSMRALGVGADRDWITVIGALDERKNVPLVMEAAQLCHRAVGILLAGAIAPGYRAEVEESVAAVRAGGVAVVTIDRLLEEEEFDAVIKLSACVVVAHSNEGPSGVLGKAAALGTRVLAAGALSLRRDCEELGDLAHWVPLEAGALAAGIDTLLGRTAPPVADIGRADLFASVLLGESK